MEPSRVHTFYAELPFSLIGSLIGREGTRLKHMVSQAVRILPFPKEDTTDTGKIKTALQKSSIKVQQHVYTDVDALVHRLEDSEVASFLWDWTPEVDEEGKAPDLVRVTVRASVPEPCFNGFLACFRATLDATVTTLIEDHYAKEQAVQDALEGVILIDSSASESESESEP